MSSSHSVGHGDGSHSRPYRSKRHRPCDVCRRRKHGCFTDQRGPCRACQKLGVQCTFIDAPRKRTNGQAQAQQRSFSRPSPISFGFTDLFADAADPGVEPSVEVTETNNHGNSLLAINDDPDVNQRNYAATGPEISVAPVHTDFWLPESSFLDPSLGLLAPFSEETATIESQQSPHVEQDPMVSATLQPRHDGGLNHQNTLVHKHHDRASRNHSNHPQSVRSLASSSGGSPAQYSVLAGEVDPYLLRHMRFKDDGTCDFGQFQYRCLAQNEWQDYSQGSHHTFPVHFLISSPPDYGAEADFGLSKLMTPDCGVRLISLFLRYIFPSLPVLSRSSLQVKPETLIPTAAALESVHPCLLAAIYAITEPFRRYDPVLCVTQASTKFPTAELWQLSYRGILREIHTSQLYVLQAILIYIQRPLDDITTATADNPGDWQLLGSAVNIAKHLGLHLDCIEWPIPVAEKRLRRRLWWILFSESIFRSILRGLPRLINADDCDISPLSETDFRIDCQASSSEEHMARHMPVVPGPCPFCYLGCDFKYLASLSVIVYDVYQALYTPSATRTLGNDFSACRRAVEPLLERLKEWRSFLPPEISAGHSGYVDRRSYFHSASAAHLKLAVLTLEVLIHRVLMHPLEVLADSDVDGSHQEHAGNGAPYIFNFGNATPQEDIPDVAESLQGSIKLAKRALEFTQGLCSYDRNSFAYSWASACFATISNFVLFLLVRAPSFDAAGEVLKILTRWIFILREQSVTFTFIRLGLLRLDTVLWAGLENSFRFPAHVKRALQNEPLSRPPMSS